MSPHKHTSITSYDFGIVKHNLYTNFPWKMCSIPHTLYAGTSVYSLYRRLTSAMLSLVPLVEGEEEKACFIRLAPSLRRLWMQNASYSSSTWAHTNTNTEGQAHIHHMCKLSHSLVQTKLTRERERRNLCTNEMKQVFEVWKPPYVTSKHPWAGSKLPKNFQLPSKLFWMCSHLTGIHSRMPNTALSLGSIQ